MYSLDVNFLKDRSGGDISRLTQTTTITLNADTIQKQMPMYIGAGVMVLLPALAGLGIVFVNWQKGQTQANIQRLEAEIAQLQGEQKKIQEIEAKTAGVHQEAEGLINVFNQIKPWSALFQEITNQLPADVQVESIQQDGAKLTLSGFASNYGALNDFLLTLQSSKFLKAEQTKLTTATANALPIAAEGVTVQSGAPDDETAAKEKGDAGVVIPPGVKYTILTEITDTPDKDLMRELIRNGAAGLVARFKFLEMKGVLDRPPGVPAAPPPAAQPPGGQAAPPPQ